MIIKIVKYFRSLFQSTVPTSYYTTDGNVLAPYPNMTNDDLKDFETAFDIESSFKNKC